MPTLHPENPPPVLVTPPEPERQLSLRGLIWPVALSLAVLGAILYFTYEPDTLSQLRSLQPGLLALAFGTVGIRIALGGGRLHYISNGALSFLGGIRGAIAWDFMSAVTPSAVGGAPLAAYFVAKDNRIAVGDATAILLFSMLMDQIWFAVSIPFILLATIWIDVFPPALGPAGAGTITAFFIGMMLWAWFFAYATLIRPQILELVATKIVRIKWLRRFEGRVRRELVELRKRSAILRSQPPRFFVVGFLWSAGIWLTRYTTILLVVMSIYPAVEWFTFLVRAGAMMLTAMAVPTPGGSGGIEGLYMLFLGPLMPKAIRGTTLLAWRLMAYHFFIAAGSALTAHAVRRRMRGRNAEAANGVEASPLAPDAPLHADRRPA